MRLDTMAGLAGSRGRNDVFMGVEQMRPRITANRRQIDNRFPVLGFTIATAGRPYYEVLLATDPALLVGDRGGGRQGGFYSSRTDSGLIRATGDADLYLVPAAALRALASGDPPPTSIFYTVVGYGDAQGADPAPALAPAELMARAPRVALAASLGASRLARVFGVATAKLQRVSQGNEDGGAAAPAELAPQVDAAEGEDGYMLPPPALARAPLPAPPREPTPPEPPAPGLAPALPGPAPGAGGAAGLSLRPARPRGASPWRPAEGQSAALGAAMGGYDDGFGDLSPFDLADLPPLAVPTPVSPAPTRTPQTRSTQPARPFARSADGFDLPFEDQDAGDDDRSRTSAGEEFALPPLRRQGSGYADEADQFDWQGLGLGYDDLGAPSKALGDEIPDALRPRLDLQPADKVAIIEHVATAESSGNYGAINADGEFEGRFGTGHPAYHRYHVGLSYGVIQFTQDSGNLGRLLARFRERDAAAFDRIFGGEGGAMEKAAVAEALLAVTTTTGPASRQASSGRSARVQPCATRARTVSGHVELQDPADLWAEPWATRFQEAGRHEPFRSEQNRLAAELFVDPIVPFAGWLGLDTPRALTIVVDRAVQMGVGGARSWIIRAIGPIAEADVPAIVAALGFADLRAFQGAITGLRADGDWGPMSHSALVAALRAHGAPIPDVDVRLPERDQMLDALVAAAAGQPYERRVRSLRDLADPAFDTPYRRT